MAWPARHGGHATAPAAVTTAQGVHGSGGRTYTAQQGRALLAALKLHEGRSNPITVEELAMSTGVNGRAVRQFLSDYDGAAFLLGGGDDGYFVCAYADEGDAFTGRIASQIRTMQERVDRRRDFAQQLPRQQEGLF